MKSFIVLVLAALSFLFPFASFANGLATTAATQIAAASTEVTTYATAILGVLITIAIATIIFGMTKRSH